MMKRFPDLSITEGVITRGLIETILGDEALSIGLSGDGEDIISSTRMPEQVEKAYKDYVFRTAHLWILDEEENQIGWVFLVHGNEEDVISDYTLEVEDIIRPVLDFVNPS